MHSLSCLDQELKRSGEVTQPESRKEEPLACDSFDPRITLLHLPPSRRLSRECSNLL